MQSHLWQLKLDKDIEDFRTKLADIKSKEKKLLETEEGRESWLDRMWKKLVPHSVVLSKPEINLRDVARFAEQFSLKVYTIESLREEAFGSQPVDPGQQNPTSAGNIQAQVATGPTL